MKVVHFVSSLKRGGAQTFMCRLIAEWPAEHLVCSLDTTGVVADDLRQLGVIVQTAPRWFGRSLIERVRFVTRGSFSRPDVCAGWMYHGNLAASLAGLVTGSPVVWNVRHSLHDIASEKLSLQGVIRLGASVSRQPRVIVYNSSVAARQHEDFGYFPDRRTVLPNGLDVQLFRPDAELGRRLRDDLGIPSDAFVVGHVARFHPMKDHSMFLHAAAMLARQVPSARFVLAGTGVEESNRALVDRIAAEAIGDRVHLLGERDDIPRIMTAFDVFAVSSAWGEAFPNVVAEAMACSLPVVATDVGDTRFLTGESGYVVPAGDSLGLYKALLRISRLSESERGRIGAEARNRVSEEFSIQSVAQRYADIFGAARAG